MPIPLCYGLTLLTDVLGHHYYMIPELTAERYVTHLTVGLAFDDVDQ